MIRLKRKNTAWLAVLALIITVALFAAPVALPVQFALISLFAIAAIASTVEIGSERESLIDALRRAPVRQRVSPQAKEAQERARTRGGYVNNDLLMLDVGLISMNSSPEGMAFRRARTVSKDDDGMRPFVTLHVEPTEAERNAVIRFEIFDQYGEQQFVHELRAYLREGEMNIMTDHHLPLAGNGGVTGSGDWDLRVYVDGNLVGMHNFMLSPSMRERQRRLAGEETVQDRYAYDVIDEVEQELPPRLQDLLGNQGGQSRPRTQTRLSDAPQSSRSSSDADDEAGRSRQRSRTSSTRRRR
jgi:hypothetical protein